MRGGGLILVVDDQPDVLEMMVKVLSLRHSVCGASCGSDALAMVERFREIDTLVTDIDMPEMNGLELAEEARKLRKTLAIVYVTGGSHDEVFDPAFLEAAGAVAVRKPFRIAQLEEAINRARALLVRLER
ncbi:MAG: response regulator [Deltaproteobacteria bacterium]|nr:MAG: response regulator [Deltaproteobacteria bacterium]